MSRSLAARPWTPAPVEHRVASVSTRFAQLDAAAAATEIDRLVAENHRIHDEDCVNLPG